MWWSFQRSFKLTVGCGGRVEQEQKDSQAGNAGELHLDRFLLSVREGTLELVRMSGNSPPRHTLYISENSNIQNSDSVYLSNFFERLYLDVSTKPALGIRFSVPKISGDKHVGHVINTMTHFHALPLENKDSAMTLEYYLSISWLYISCDAAIWSWRSSFWRVADDHHI